MLGYTRDEFKETIDALASGLIDAGPMITDVVGIDAVSAMFQALKSPGARAKVMLEFPRQS